MDFTAFEVRTIQTRRRQNKKTFLESILKVFAGWAGRASGNQSICLRFFSEGSGKIIYIPYFRKKLSLTTTEGSRLMLLLGPGKNSH